MPEEIFTRAQYMAFKGEAQMREFHRKYYGQIAEEARIGFSAGFIADCAAALAAGDEHLNTIRLSRWDSMTTRYEPAVRAAVKKRGDFYSLGDGVCALKEAARRAVARSQSNG